MHRLARFTWYSLFVTALFYEWIVPLQLSTDTVRIDIFLLAFVFLVVTDVLYIPFWLRIVIKPLFFILMLHWLFFAPDSFPFFGSEWLHAAWQTLTSDFHFLAPESWMMLSPLLRTSFFFLFIWLMEAVMFRYVVKGGRVFWILLLTVLYLSVLDSFTPYDGGMAIVRTFCYGIVTLAFSRLDQLLHRSQGQLRTSHSDHYARLRLLPWFAATLAFVLLAVTVGVFAPKSEARWKNPISILAGYDEGVGGGERKVGYSDDDSRLGGPFEQDTEIVFRSVIEQPYYWRGEAKDLYDGHGWQHQQEAGNHVTLTDDGEIEPNLYHNIETKRLSQQTVFAKERYSVMFTAGQLRRIRDVDGLRGQRIFGTEDASGVVTEDGATLLSYHIDVEQPIVNEQQLRESGTAYSEEIQNRYLQLPDSLPDRVRQLSEEIVKDADNVYDRVKAIESYLKLGANYSYETEDVPITPEESDFVDHFLFETQRGYCDHFSTAMVVLLRASGIPARWAKGFSPGDATYDIETGNYEVTVTNANAHSWPEVYFAGVGWLPFEPTPSFNNPTDISRASDDGAPTEEVSQPDIPEVANFEDIRSGQELEVDTPPSENNAASFASSRQWQPIGFVPIVFVGVLVVVGLFLWFVKPRWLWRWRFNRLQEQNSRSDPDHLLSAYEQLFQLLGEKFGPRKPEQTVREYISSSINLEKNQRHTVIELMKLYEQTRYANKTFSEAYWQEVREKLRRFVNELRI